ncbi:MAG TPA: hypothetical protein GXX15_10560 [Clostridia bacterium]|nr:hypothetical protein [Clostridia bacterium]
MAFKNERQKEFLRQIREYEEEKRRKGIEEPLSYVNENYRPRTYTKAISLISIIPILIFLWNAFAISTWIKPILLRAGLLTESKNTSSSVFLKDLKSRQAKISDYIQNVNKVEKDLISYLNSANITTTEQDLIIIQNKIDLLKNEINDTNISTLTPLKENIFSQIELSKEIVNNYINYNKTKSLGDLQKIHELIDEFNKSNKEQRNIIIDILKKENMPYIIDDDGTIHYQYIR